MRQDREGRVRHLTDFLPFDTVVPLRSGTEYYEAALNAVENPSRIGAALRGKSMRTFSAAEFASIARAGLAETLDAARAHGSEYSDSRMDPSMEALIRAPRDEQERRIMQMLSNRPLRDAAFRTSVVNAYDEQCTVTRLRIINGGGRAEVQAAHIWPVADGRTERRAERHRAVRDLPLTVRPAPHQPDRQLRPARVTQPGAGRTSEPLREAGGQNPPACGRVAMAAAGVRHPASGPIRRPRTIIRAGYTGTRLQGVRQRQDGRGARANRDRYDCPPWYPIRSCRVAPNAPLPQNRFQNFNCYLSDRQFCKSLKRMRISSIA